MQEAILESATGRFPLWTRVAFVIGVAAFFASLGTLWATPLIHSPAVVTIAFGVLAFGAALVAIALGAASSATRSI